MGLCYAYQSAAAWEVPKDFVLVYGDIINENGMGYSLIEATYVTHYLTAACKARVSLHRTGGSIDPR